MQEELYISLLQKQLSGPLTAEEQSELDAWLAQSPDNQLVARQVAQVWQASGGFSQDVELDLDADFERLEQRIAAAEPSAQAKLVPLPPKRRWLAIAAAVVLLLAATFVLRNFLGGDGMEQFAVGSSPARTPLTLADGSKVWLNAGSVLRYFGKNNSSDRRVELEGEAFFEVAKDPGRPFIVKGTLGEVTVLGTSFNVRSHGTAPTLEVNVTSGKVRLQPAGTEQHLDLVANETGIFNKTSNSLTKTGGDSNNSAAWHTGRLVFDNTPLGKVLSQLSDTYGVKLGTDNPAAINCPMTVSFDKAPFQTVLMTLATVFSAKVEQVGPKEYRLSGVKCGGF